MTVEVPWWLFSSEEMIRWESHSPFHPSFCVASQLSVINQFVSIRICFDHWFPDKAENSRINLCTICVELYLQALIMSEYSFLQRMPTSLVSFPNPHRSLNETSATLTTKTTHNQFCKPPPSLSLTKSLAIYYVSERHVNETQVDCDFLFRRFILFSRHELPYGQFDIPEFPPYSLIYIPSDFCYQLWKPNH